MRKKIVLSKRLHALALLVTAGNRVCDVGCDHGFVSIYLVKQGIAPKALAMDVNAGPLGQAKENIAAFGLESYIETRISDGLRSYQCGEADSLICAGMGGKLMKRILMDDKKKTASFQELILQPQSEVEEFRVFLREEGYLLIEENMIEEDAKFYPMMKAVKREKTLTREDSIEECSQKHVWKQQMEDRYGPVLLAGKDPVLYRYLEREKRICAEVLESLRQHGADGSERDKRYREVEEQMQNCLRIMKEFNERGESGIW